MDKSYQKFLRLGISHELVGIETRNDETLYFLIGWAGVDGVEYEQGGSDRTEYGTHLLKNLENQISEKGLNTTLFKACRQFYLIYPQIGSTVSNQFVTQPELLVNHLDFHMRI